jgi:hypothetical protein
MRLNYGLEHHGWATVTLECGDDSIQMAASYLHDSLRDLASGARAIVAGAPEVKVVFMDEPGERELIIRRATDTTVSLEVLWYDGWKSWGQFSGKGNRVFSGTTTVAHVGGQLVSELRRLLNEHGE